MLSSQTHTSHERTQLTILKSTCCSQMFS